MGETDPKQTLSSLRLCVSLCLDRGGEQLGHFLSILADEVARLQLMVGEMEAIDPMAAHIIRQILSQVEQVNEGLLDRPDMLEGGISWWEEWASANRPTQ
jgi:hypothetical protein